MSINTSKIGLAHIKALAHAALTRPDGVAVITTAGEAYKLRQAFYSLRKRDRLDNEKIYPVGNAQHGASVYDSIEVQLQKQEDGRMAFYLRTMLAKLTDYEIIDVESGKPISSKDLLI